MHRFSFVAVVVLVFTQPNAYAVENLTVQQWIDSFVDTCVGSGSNSFVSGSLTGAGTVSLKKFLADGTLSGEVQATHETYRLLSDGISDKMSAVAAGEADKVRDCLAPVRQTLVQVMNLQLIGNSNLKQLYILSPDEDKIMRALAITRGEDGQTGKNVAIKKLLEQTGLSDIRFRTTMRMLTSKVFANELSYPKLVQSGTGMASIVMVDSVSLWDDGEDYIIKMGYAK